MQQEILQTHLFNSQDKDLMKKISWLREIYLFNEIVACLIPDTNKNIDTNRYNTNKDKNTNAQIQIHKYKYTNTNTQIQILKYKYTNTQIQM